MGAAKLNETNCQRKCQLTEKIIPMLIYCIVAFFISFFACGLLIHKARKHARNYPVDMPQRSHKGCIPRIGGVAMAIGMGVSVSLAFFASTKGGDAGNLQLQVWCLLWGLCMVPAVLGGLIDDLTQRMTVRWRFILTFATGVLAAVLLGARVPHIDIPIFDSAFQAWPWLGIALAVVAIAGLPHAINIIDGYNGLAGIVSIILSLALAHVSIQVNDRALAFLFLMNAAASAGFIVWNYPWGKIFAGDSGAYLWGSVIAIGSILLVQRHEAVSPWFPLLLLIYPVWETIFSMYRKWVRGVSPGTADALHFHQLIFRRVVHRYIGDGDAREVLARNNLTAPYLWVYTVITVLPAIVFWRNTFALILFSLFFSFMYTLVYLAMVRFKVPSFLKF